MASPPIVLRHRDGTPTTPKTGGARFSRVYQCTYFLLQFLSIRPLANNAQYGGENCHHERSLEKTVVADDHGVAGKAGHHHGHGENIRTRRRGGATMIGNT